MFKFNGFLITAILFASKFPDTEYIQGILMKGKRSMEGKEKLIFAIIKKDDAGKNFSIFDAVVLPIPSDYKDAAMLTEVTIGDDLTSATLKLLSKTSEISITLTDIDIEVYTENYVFTPASNMLKLSID